jgi:hypothetical protein
MPATILDQKARRKALPPAGDTAYADPEDASQDARARRRVGAHRLEELPIAGGH